MNIRIPTLLGIALIVAACGGSNPFIVDPDPGTDPGTDPDPGTPIEGERDLPPGTASPSPAQGIFRREAPSTEQNGNGAVRSITRLSGDRFEVEGLAFDGDNIYTRSGPVQTLEPVTGAITGPFAVYEAAAQYPDDVTNTAINQLTHRALYGVSSSGDVAFAILRTGAYTGYGFGGFVYQRNGSVTLPTTGQATYRGDYAGLRDFEGVGGLEYATGTMTVDIDFDAFTAQTGAARTAVKGAVTNREIYDIDGNNITRDILDALEVEYGLTYTALPAILFTIGPNVMDANGEIVGTVSNTLTTSTGAIEFETGQYYAILSGDVTQGGADNIVGIIVTESTADARFTGNVTVRETGGFVLGRN